MPIAAKTTANCSAPPRTLAWRAICAATSLCGSPAPEKSGSFWPRTRLFSPSMLEMPVWMNSCGRSRATGLIGAPMMGRRFSGMSGGRPSMGSPRPLNRRPVISRGAPKRAHPPHRPPPGPGGGGLDRERLRQLSQEFRDVRLKLLLRYALQPRDLFDGRQVEEVVHEHAALQRRRPFVVESEDGLENPVRLGERRKGVVAEGRLLQEVLAEHLPGLDHQPLIALKRGGADQPDHL